MRQTKEQHREYMREYRRKKRLQKPVGSSADTSIVEPKNQQMSRGDISTQPEINIEVYQGKSDFRAKRKILIKFVRFDLYKPSNRDECLKVRLSKLGLFHEDADRLEEHFILCEGCRDWFESWKVGDENNPTLFSLDGLEIFLAYRKDFPTEQDFWNKLKQINGKIIAIDKKLEKITVVVDPNETNPNKIEYPSSSLDLSGFQLWKDESKQREQSSLSKDVEYQQSLTRQEPEQSQQQQEQPSQPEQQPQRKSNNPSYEEWSQSHSG